MADNEMPRLPSTSNAHRAHPYANAHRHRHPIPVIKKEIEVVEEQAKKTHVTCTVCRDKLASDGSGSLPCGHTFHVHCIENWFETKPHSSSTPTNTVGSCPYCRKLASSKDVHKVFLTEEEQSDDEELKEKHEDEKKKLKEKVDFYKRQFLTAKAKQAELSEIVQSGDNEKVKEELKKKLKEEKERKMEPKLWASRRGPKRFSGHPELLDLYHECDPIEKKYMRCNSCNGKHNISTAKQLIKHSSWCTLNRNPVKVEEEEEDAEQGEEQEEMAELAIAEEEAEEIGEFEVEDEEMAEAANAQEEADEIGEHEVED